MSLCTGAGEQHSAPNKTAASPAALSSLTEGQLTLQSHTSARLSPAIVLSLTLPFVQTTHSTVHACTMRKRARLLHDMGVVFILSVLYLLDLITF